jgi:transcriptional regulator with XRE-family HTH domain
MDSRTELGEFLRSRRAAVKPQDVGLQDYGRRRVPGLRREELSMLAGVSVEHYTRIEQGRGVRASAQVLDAIASALSLSDAERAHLHDLAEPEPEPTSRRRPRLQQRVAPGIVRLLGQLHDHPAFVLGRRMDVLAWNPLAAALLGDFSRLEPRRRNMARLVFLDEETIALYPEWERVARETVAFLRRDSARDLEDPQLAELIGELSLKSESFRRWWNSREVRDKASGTKRFRHPVVGELELTYETLLPAGALDQALVMYTAEPGSRSYTALQLLATVAAEGQPGARGPSSDQGDAAGADVVHGRHHADLS